MKPDLVDAIERRTPAGGVGLAALWTLYVLTFRQHLHGRRWMVMAVLFLLPAGLAILIRATASDAPSIALEFTLAFMFIPQALLPLVGLVYASGIIQDEQEDQTLTYLLIRPLPKWAIYGVKLLATLTTTVLLTTVFTVLTYAAIYVGTDTTGVNVPLRCLKAVWIHDLAVICYCCLFGVMSLFTRWTLVVGILYTAIFEGLFANLPFGIRLITVIYYTRLLAYRSMEFVAVERTREDIAAVVWQYDVRADPTLADHPSVQTCLIALAAASLVFAVVAAIVCSRREFHVKTPEGN